MGEVKALYCEYTGAPDSMEKLLDFVALQQVAGPVESDMVHELLAYLVERMMVINKEKNAEIKAFPGFPVGGIDAPIMA